MIEHAFRKGDSSRVGSLAVLIRQIKFFADKAETQHRLEIPREFILQLNFSPLSFLRSSRGAKISSFIIPPLRIVKMSREN